LWAQPLFDLPALDQQFQCVYANMFGGNHHMQSGVKQPLAKADEIALVRRNYVVVMLLFIVAAGLVDVFGFVF
jgi:hypothetical protein